jgi:diguanylate cyclase (GGDEF)-like protein
MDPETVAALLVAGNCIQLIMLVLHRKGNGGGAGSVGAAVYLHLAGLGALTAGFAMPYASRLFEPWLWAGLRPLAFIGGACLEAMALIAAASMLTHRLRWIPPSLAAATCAALLAAAVIGAPAPLGAMVFAVYTAALAGLSATTLLRGRGRSALRLGAGIIFAAFCLADLVWVVLSSSGRIAAGFDEGRGLAAAFLAMQFMGASIILLVKESSDQLFVSGATHDTLTGILNRNGFSEAVAKSMAMCSRHNIAYSLISFDIDGFRGINDARGHGAGDRVLKDFAAKIGSRIRTYDHFCRMGGDEFVLFLQTVDLQKVENVVGRLLAGVGNAEPGVIGYRISAGAVCVDYPSGRPIGFSELQTACTGALSAAKGKGGARMEIAPF